MSSEGLGEGARQNGFGEGLPLALPFVNAGIETNRWPVELVPPIRLPPRLPAERTQISGLPSDRRWSRCLATAAGSSWVSAKTHTSNRSLLPGSRARRKRAVLWTPAPRFKTWYSFTPYVGQ